MFGTATSSDKSTKKKCEELTLFKVLNNNQKRILKLASSDKGIYYKSVSEPE